MIYSVEPGDVFECTRDHFAFAIIGPAGIIELRKGELLLAIRVSPGYIVDAIRVKTSEMISIMPVSVACVDDVYEKIWP